MKALVKLYCVLTVVDFQKQTRRDTVGWWIGLLCPSKKVPGLNPGRVCMFSPCGFSSGTLVSTHSPKHSCLVDGRLWTGPQCEHETRWWVYSLPLQQISATLLGYKSDKIMAEWKKQAKLSGTQKQLYDYPRYTPHTHTLNTPFPTCLCPKQDL